MSIRLIPLFIAFVSSTLANGQTSSDHLDTLVTNYVTALRVDSICIYQDYCVGCLYMWKKDEDKCNFEGLFVPTYIIWKDHGKTFMTKKDNCFDYSVTRIPGDSIWTYFFENEDSIKKEELKIPQYIEIKNGKETMRSTTINHSHHQGLKVIVGGNNIIEKDLDDFYLTKEVGFHQEMNINYDYNVNSRLKNFQLIIARAIKRGTNKNQLTKTRR